MPKCCASRGAALLIGGAGIAFSVRAGEAR